MTWQKLIDRMTWMIAATVLFLGGIANAATPLRVAYAGSMGAVMDQKIGPAFARTHDVEYQGVGQASYALAHLIASKQLAADVFVPVTPGPMRLLLDNGMVKAAAPIASTQMVLVYSPKSQFAGKLAGNEKAKWYEVLESPGLRFGRTDPATDPQGRNVIFVMMLAQRYYKQANLVSKILGATRNPSQIFAEPSLLTRLESGQIDAAIGYLSAVKSQHLPYVELPPEINLSDPKYFPSWYSQVSFWTNGKDGKPVVVRPEPLVFYAASLTNAPHLAAATQFVQFLTGADGQQILRESGYDAPHGASLS
jgi:molybdate/tungstate transport system substrate-binding protein